MASATKQPHSATLSPLSRQAPVGPVSNPDSRSHASTGLTSLADAGLKASPLKQNSTLRAFRGPELTGAAAMADAERTNEKQAQGMSINPAFNPANVFARVQDSTFSRPNDVSSPGQASSTSPAVNSITAEPMQLDTPKQGPTGSALGDPKLPRHANDAVLNSNGRYSGEGPAEERSNKAFSYPPRPDQMIDRAEPNRHMSLPNSGSTRSPSSRKHRCPHCATEFTRHHNLKSHLLTHSQEKPFTCSDCNAKFRRLHDLKRHTKLHTGERPHVCEKCNRKFARGDALARHSKGPGGCAGRRGSAGEDEDGETGSRSMLDPHMDGVTYEEDDEAHQGDAKRRKSAPDHRNKRSLQVSNDPSPSSRQTSTYPPVAPMGRVEHQSDGNFQTPSQLSPRIASGFNQHVQPFASAFSQGGMTESPGPLSPGTIDSRRLSAGLPPPRARSPSLASSLAQQHISRGSGHGSPSLNLPATQISHIPHLPSIPGLGSDNRNKPGYPSPTGSSTGPRSGRPPPAISTTAPMGSVDGPGSAASTQPGSASSHHHSSGGSMREILSHAQGSSTDEWYRDYVRKTEAEKQNMRDDFSAKQASYETDIAELRAEVAVLKAQIQRSTLFPPHSMQ